MQIGDMARVDNPTRGTYGMRGKIVRISDGELPRIVDLDFPEDEGHCAWSFVEDEIKVIE